MLAIALDAEMSFSNRVSRARASASMSADVFLAWSVGAGLCEGDAWQVAHHDLQTLKTMLWRHYEKIRMTNVVW